MYRTVAPGYRLLYNKYHCTVVYILIINIAMFCHGTSLKKKKHLATWGLEHASPVSVVNRQCCLTLGLMHPFLGMHDGL